MCSFFTAVKDLLQEKRTQTGWTKEIIAYKTESSTWCARPRTRGRRRRPAAPPKRRRPWRGPSGSWRSGKPSRTGWRCGGGCGLEAGPIWRYFSSHSGILLFCPNNFKSAASLLFLKSVSVMFRTITAIFLRWRNRQVIEPWELLLVLLYYFEVTNSKIDLRSRSTNSSFTFLPSFPTVIFFRGRIRRTLIRFLFGVGSIASHIIPDRSDTWLNKWVVTLFPIQISLRGGIPCFLIKGILFKILSMPQVFEQSLFFLFKGLALLFLLWLLLLLRLLRLSLFHLLSFSGNMALKQKTHKRIFAHLIRPTPCTSPRPPRPCRRNGTPGPTSSGTGKCLNKRQTTILFCYPAYI